MALLIAAAFPPWAFKEVGEVAGLVEGAFDADAARAVAIPRRRAVAGEDEFSVCPCPRNKGGWSPRRRPMFWGRVLRPGDVVVPAIGMAEPGVEIVHPLGDLAAAGRPPGGLRAAGLARTMLSTWLTMVSKLVKGRTGSPLGRANLSPLGIWR